MADEVWCLVSTQQNTIHLILKADISSTTSHYTTKRLVVWCAVKTRPTIFYYTLIQNRMWQKFCSPYFEELTMQKINYVFPLHTTRNSVQALQAVVNDSVVSRGLWSLCSPYVITCDFCVWRNLNTVHIIHARWRPWGIEIINVILKINCGG